MSVTTIGVISDTHGLLRPEVFQLFRDVQLIIRRRHRFGVGSHGTGSDCPGARGLRKHGRLPFNGAGARAKVVSNQTGTCFCHPRGGTFGADETTLSGNPALRFGRLRPYPSGPEDQRSGGGLFQPGLGRSAPLLSSRYGWKRSARPVQDISTGCGDRRFMIT